VKYEKADLTEVEGGGRVEAGSQVRRLQLPRREAVRTVQTHVLLLRRVPEVCLEEAQEDVQGADESAGDRGRAPHPSQGHFPPELVHTDKWGWGWTNERGAWVPVARSSVLIT